VLIVDDNQTNRAILKEITAAWGLVPSEAADGKEALAMIQCSLEQERPYALILLDYHMPGMDGIELARRAKELMQGSATRLIMLTSSGKKGDARHCREAGINGYLVKPINQNELRTALGMALRPAGEDAPLFITRHAVQEAQARLNILLAEDNPVNQKVAVGLLEKRGHRVTLARNGKEAVAARDRGEFDLILMDMQMPEMDGFEATRTIREKERQTGGHIPIIAMTARAMKGDRERCLAAGMEDYVSKPIKVDELFAALEKQTRGKGGEGKVAGTPPKEVFDLNGALELVAGDRQLFMEIAHMFLEGLPDHLNRIHEGVDNGDAHTLENAAHALKGSVGNFCAKRSFDAAYRLERLGREGRISEAREALAELESTLPGLEAAMRQALSELGGTE
jgi:CheY-like chemotaxis protein/HPt (histidine-containing phosphotransfer) domain-containing protein